MIVQFSFENVDVLRINYISWEVIPCFHWAIIERIVLNAPDTIFCSTIVELEVMFPATGVCRK